MSYFESANAQNRSSENQRAAGMIQIEKFMFKQFLTGR
jgi:hypothetical protein